MSQTFSLFINTTQKCNMNCKYCYVKDVLTPDSTIIKKKYIYKIIDLIKDEYREVSILFHGGEPTVINPRWYFSLVTMLHKKFPDLKFRFSMQSNGLLLDKRENLYNVLGMTRSISYDGISGIKNRGKVSIKISENIKKVAEEYDVHIVSVATNDFLDNIINEYKHIKSLGVKSLKINNLFADSVDEEYVHKYVDSLLKLHKYQLEEDTPLYVAQIENVKEVSKGYASGACNLKCEESWVGLDEKGRVSMCDIGVYPESETFGHIDNFNDSADLMYSDKRVNIITEMSERQGLCFESDCPIKHICNGVCNGVLFREFGNNREVGGLTCLFEQLKYTKFKEEFDKKGVVHIEENKKCNGNRCI